MRTSPTRAALKAGGALCIVAASFSITLKVLDRPLPQPSRSTSNADPFGTASKSYVMAGYKGVITPAASGDVAFDVVTTGGVQGCRARLAYGTGNPPGPGASAIGTVVGAEITVFSAAAASPLNLQGYVTGLKIGTSYWFDVQVEVYGSGANTCYLQAAKWSATEK